MMDLEKVGKNIKQLKKYKHMTKDKALDIISSFLIEHLDGNKLWGDDTYTEEVEALVKLKICSGADVALRQDGERTDFIGEYMSR